MTIKDIARLSGCSISTISRVINNRPDVNAETKAKIMQIMQEHDYVPNNNARQLKIQQSRNIVFAIKGTQNMFFGDLLVKLQHYTEEFGYNGVVSYLDENQNEFKAVSRILRELKPKGIIFLGGSVPVFEEYFSTVNIPAVLATLVSDKLNFPNLSMVGVDDEKAGEMAIEHLIAHGHKKIAILGGSASSSPSQARYKGAINAIEKHGLTFDTRNYGSSNYNFEDAYNAMNEMLARRSEFTAVFAMSDTIAIGAMRALINAGYNIPDDISIIGLDGISLSRFTNPTLVSVRQPAELICKESVSLLVSQIERHKTGKTVVLESEILEGNSIRSI